MYDKIISLPFSGIHFDGVIHSVRFQKQSTAGAICVALKALRALLCVRSARLKRTVFTSLPAFTLEQYSDHDESCFRQFQPVSLA